MFSSQNCFLERKEGGNCVQSGLGAKISNVTPQLSRNLLRELRNTGETVFEQRTRNGRCKMNPMHFNNRAGEC